MTGVMAVVIRPGLWRSGGGAGNSAQSSADGRANAGAAPAAGDCADYGPGAGAHQTAADRAVGRVVRIGEAAAESTSPAAITAAKVDFSIIASSSTAGQRQVLHSPVYGHASNA
jgi:hypothetical protein